MKIILNIKILLHYFIVIVFMVLIFNFVSNEVILITLVSLLIVTLIINKTSYCKIKEDRIILIESLIGIIPISKVEIQKKEIRKIIIKDLTRINNEALWNLFEFEGDTVVKLITGQLFYNPQYLIVIDTNKDTRIEFEMNLVSKKQLQELLSLQITDNLN